jgi:hypothetical protein
VTCTEKRRRFLKSVELYGHWQPMCFNCSGQLLHILPLPPTMAELKEAVSRERRKVDRRIGKADSRVFQYERRVGERRALRAEYPTVDDDMIIEVSVETDDLLMTTEFEDLTQIRELISSLDPAIEPSGPNAPQVSEPASHKRPPHRASTSQLDRALESAPALQPFELVPQASGSQPNASEPSKNAAAPFELSQPFELASQPFELMSHEDETGPVLIVG